MIQKINAEIIPVLTAFLEDKESYDLFVSEAKKLGYTGTDFNKIKVALFTPDNHGEIGFASNEVYDKFVDFQIIYNLKDKEPYKTLLQTRPEIKNELIEIGKDILFGKDVNTDRILALFPKAEI